MVNFGPNYTMAETPVLLTPALSQQPIERSIMTSRYPPRNKWRIFASCLFAVCGGFSDAAPGALLPSIEKAYGVSYAVVSLIWMLNAVGFILVAGLAHKIQPWLGKHKLVPFGCSFSVIMYIMVLSGGPFPVVVIGFFFGGVGLAIVLAQVNVFLSKLDKQSKYLAFFHGSYGIGATISPLAATSMINHGVRWNYVYFIMLGLLLINCINCWFAFSGADEDLLPWDDEEEPLIRPTDTPVPGTPREMESGVGLQDLGAHITHAIMENDKAKTSAMRLALVNPLTWFVSLFVFCYQGAEVSLGGWIVSYLLDYRQANTSYGYVLSGFWGGLTVGRLLFTRPLHKTLGARRSITILALLTITLIILTWVVSSKLALGVFVSIAGAMIGPTYPLMITAVTNGVLPRKIQVVSLTIMTAFGLSGGAIVPFITGLVAEGVGTWVVLPIFITLYSLMLLIWLYLPNVDRKHETQDAGLLQRVWHQIW